MYTWWRWRWSEPSIVYYVQNYGRRTDGNIVKKSFQYDWWYLRRGIFRIVPVTYLNLKLYCNREYPAIGRPRNTVIARFINYSSHLADKQTRQTHIDMSWNYKAKAPIDIRVWTASWSRFQCFSSLWKKTLFFKYPTITTCYYMLLVE